MILQSTVGIFLLLLFTNTYIQKYAHMQIQMACMVSHFNILKEQKTKKYSQNYSNSNSGYSLNNLQFFHSLTEKSALN